MKISTTGLYSPLPRVRTRALLVIAALSGTLCAVAAETTETPPEPTSGPTPTAAEKPAPARPRQAAPDASAATSAQSDSAGPAPTIQPPAPVQRKQVPLSTLRRPEPIRRTTRPHGVFLVPLQFDPEDNGLSIDNPQLRWAYNLQTDAVNFGGRDIAGDSIAVTLDQVKRQAAPVKYDDRKTETWLTTLSLRWPSRFTRTGHISIETLDGQALWRLDVDEAQLAAWKNDFRFATPEMTKNHTTEGWGRFDIVRSEFEFLYKGGTFRACLTNEENEAERLKICSAPFISKSKGERIKFFRIKSFKVAEPGVYLNEKKLESTGLLNFPPGKALTIAIKFASGTTIEISSQPADPMLLDAVQSHDGKEVLLTGTGAQPLGQRVRIIKRPITHFWAPTGIKQEKIWQCAIPADVPTVTVRGAFGLPFTLLFNFDRLPREEDRVFIEQTRSSGTYSSAPVVRGYIASAAELSSTELSVTKTDPYNFEWRFNAPNSGAENRSRLSIKKNDSDKPWVAHYRMQRSYPTELSTRMTGILDSEYRVLIFGEISAAHWFETVAGWQHPLFSKQRWGLSARYFRALTPLQATTGESITDFSVLNADAKYNILQGIWHHDELVGLNFSSQAILVAGQNATLLGGGVYWARTMPRIFNDLFNYLPYLEYPKYVDMEFIYYPISLTSGIAGGATFALNFHGRVFWTHRVYGEMGFGLRRYQFSVPRPNQPGRTSVMDISTMYGNVGLGFIF